MGNRYLFRCMSCNYETNCSKGEDRGFVSAVKPFLCTTCGEVNNAIVGKSERRGGPINIPIEPTCNICKSNAGLEEWDLLTCPKCNKPDMHYHYLPIAWD